MSTTIIVVFALFFVLRLSTLFISIKNEKRLKQSGAQEYGKLNSAILAILHFIFYVSAFSEGYIDDVQFSRVTIFGIILYLFSMAALFYVIRQLSPIWTVKLIIAKDHQINKSSLFKYIRHPNYFLNIIPELIGLALVMESYISLLVISPAYLVSLTVRIVQEEKIMRSNFLEY